MAVVFDAGMPSVSSGISVAVMVALLAFGAGPRLQWRRWCRILPSACSASFCGVAQKVGISLPPAGTVPNGKPMKVARIQAGQSASTFLGHVGAGQAVLGFVHPAFVHHVGAPRPRRTGHRNQHHFDAVHQLRHTTGVAGLAGDLVDADQPIARPTNNATMPRSVPCPAPRSRW